MANNFSLVVSYGKKRVIGGYQARKTKSKAASFNADRYADEELPEKIDLRPYMTRVEDQGQIGSCVANATAGAYEYLYKIATGEDVDVSRLFVYYNGRVLNGTDQEDAGMLCEDAIQVVLDHGVCTEQTWRYAPKNVFKEPSNDAYDEATAFKVDSYLQVPWSLAMWKHALAHGYPIIFGVNIYTSFQTEGEKKGMIPLPDKENEKLEGGHAMLCVGYSDEYEVFIVRNSWGTHWGDKGYCYIPYAYMEDADLNDIPDDAYIIRQIEDLDFGADQWVEHAKVSVFSKDWHDKDEIIDEDYPLDLEESYYWDEFYSDSSAEEEGDEEEEYEDEEGEEGEEEEYEEGEEEEYEEEEYEDEEGESEEEESEEEEYDEEEGEEGDETSEDSDDGDRR